MANLFKYTSEAAYIADSGSRPAHESSVSFDGAATHFDGKNALVPLETADGVNIVLSESGSFRKFAIPEAQFDPVAALNPKYTVLGVMFGKINGKAIVLHKEESGQRWGQSNFYKLTPESSGSFNWSVTINGSAKSGSCSWSSNAVATIVSQINAVTSIATDRGTFVGISVDTYNNSAFTITSVTGVTLTDQSTQCWVNDEKKSEVHRQWQAVLVVNLNLGLNWNDYTTAQYSKGGWNNSYYCGGNFVKFKSWASSSGTGSYVAESSIGIMNSAGFASCASGTAEAQAVYNKYNGSYDAYLKAHMVNIFDRHYDGIEHIGYGRGLELTKMLASVETLDYDGNKVPAFPAAYWAYHKYVSANGDPDCAQGNWYMPTNTEVAMFMEDDTYAQINSAMAKIGGARLYNSPSTWPTGYYWSVSEYNSYYAWCYSGDFGRMNGDSKINGLMVRSCLAL